MGEGFFFFFFWGGGGGGGGHGFLGGGTEGDQLSPTEYRVLWGPRIIDCN